MANRPIWSDDYAHLPIPNVAECYYGYEVTTEDGEWCFRAQMHRGETITVPGSDLGMRDKWDVMEGLLRGIAHLGETGQILDSVREEETA